MPQKNWDKYEVALLIEAYQNIKQGRVDRNTALVALSQNLRQIAINEGLEIDDTFRNLNGMQWQMGFIERAFIGEDYESRTPPRIFIEMVATFNENQAEFQAILDEAHSKILGIKVRCMILKPTIPMNAITSIAPRTLTKQPEQQDFFAFDII